MDPHQDAASDEHQVKGQSIGFRQERSASLIPTIDEAMETRKGSESPAEDSDTGTDVEDASVRLFVYDDCPDSQEFQINPERVSFLRGVTITAYWNRHWKRLSTMLHLIQPAHSPEDLDLSLILAEHHLRTRGPGYEPCARFFNTVVESPMFSYEDVINWSNELHRLGRYLSAILLTYAAMKKYDTIQNFLCDPDYLKRIGQFLYALGMRGYYLALSGGNNSKEIAKEYVRGELLTSIFNDLRELDDTVERDMALAHYFYAIFRCSMLLSLEQRVVDFLRIGIFKVKRCGMADMEQFELCREMVKTLVDVFLKEDDYKLVVDEIEDLLLYVERNTFMDDNTKRAACSELNGLIECYESEIATTSRNVRPPKEKRRIFYPDMFPRIYRGITK